MIVAAILAALILGFLAGLLSFKVKARWCPQCGTTLDCQDCTARRRRTFAISASGDPN